jgi:hypothetical protein
MHSSKKVLVKELEDIFDAGYYRSCLSHHESDMMTTGTSFRVEENYIKGEAETTEDEATWERNC